MNNIESVRKAHKLTRPDLADLVGVKPGTVFAWERRGQYPDMRTAIRMADVLETSLDYLFGRSST